MIIGIDLGTTNSLVAIFTSDGPQLIPNSLDKHLTPSAIHMQKDGVALIGESAKNHLVNFPEMTTSRFKQLMGTRQQTRLGKKDFRPEDLSSLVLRSLKEDAEHYTGEKITDVVISVPAYFNDIQRKATISAAHIAGLNVKRLINEPTAAALAYGLHEKEDENTFLIVDLGGGTFDVSILEMFSGVMEVRSSAGDAFLGGENFTDRIVDYFAKQSDLKTDDLDADELSRLRQIADQAKHLLGEAPNASVSFRKGEREIELTITREMFEEISTDLINRMKIPLQRAINDAGLKASEINKIVLVGGATRMLVVRNLITRLFARFPEYALDPDTVVALGAAVQAGLIARDAALDDIVMTDVCPFTLGYETTRKIGPGNNYETGIFSPLIERNTTIPVSRNHIISPTELGQKQIDIRVFQGESPHVRDNIRIGEYTISIPYNLKAHEQVDLRFTYDNSGVLEVLSKVLSTGKESKLIIESNPGGLTKKEIEARFKELDRIKIHPRDEAQNEALIAQIKAIYANSLGDKRQLLSEYLSEYEAVLNTFDKRLIQEKRVEITERLKHLEAMNVFE